MLNQDKIFKSLKEELVVLKTLKSGPISDIYLCLYKEKKSIMRVDRSWTSSMKFDRQTEILLINEIIKLNLAPKILHSDTKLGLLIWRFVEGDEFFLDSINNKKNLKLLGASIKKLHEVPVPKKAKNIFKDSLDLYQNNSVKNLENKFLYKGINIFKDLLKDDEEYVFSHNDLNKTNIILNKTFYFLDWEYAGLNHPYFDLALSSSSLNLNEKEISYLWEGYSDNKYALNMKKLHNWSIFSSFLDYMWRLKVIDLSENTIETMQINELERKLTPYL